MNTPAKKQQVIWAKGEKMYSDFLEQLSFFYDVDAQKIARTPRTHILEFFVAAKDQSKRNQLMFAEYQSNKNSTAQRSAIAARKEASK